MDYSQNEKSTGLDVLTTIDSGDLIIIGDVSDSGKAKAITRDNLADDIADVIKNDTGLVETVTGLNTDNSDPYNPVVQISVDGVTITGDGTPGDPLVAVGGGGGGGGGGGLQGKIFTGSRNHTTATGTTVIAHGLGAAPLFVSLKMTGTTSGTLFWSLGAYDGTNNKCVYQGTASGTPVNDDTVAGRLEFQNGGNYQTATITVDDTNITIHWTKVGSPSAGTDYYEIEAFIGGGSINLSGYDTASSAFQNSIQVHTITHNLGVVPKLINLKVLNDSAAGGGGHSISEGSASTDGVSTILNQQCCVPLMVTGPSASVINASSSTQIGTATGNGSLVRGELTAVTATTFEITWQATTNIDGTPVYIWEVTA